MENKHLTGEIAKELDFYRIRDTIAGLAISEEGRDLLLQRESTSESKSINHLKNLGKEWNTYLHSTRPSALSAWPPVKRLFNVLGVEGSSLLQEDVFALGLFCNSAIRTKTALTTAKDELNLKELGSIAEQMPSLEQAKNEIFSILAEDGQIRDLPQLREIRNNIAKLHREIENAIRKYTSDSSLSDALQSNVPAFRADRQLIAVRANHRNAIKGIIHEVSASGQTVYIEPDEVVRANNDLIQEEFHLQSEIRHILIDLTQRLGLYKEDFRAVHEIMMMLDTTYAAGRYQYNTNGIFAEECDLTLEPPVIYKARHPLLGEKAVPVDVHFMDGKRVLIITGPNTGGKTVTLKTIALFALLNQAGFPIPAGEGTRLPIFSSIFADIGDEQSIDQSLSTFSAHMKKIADMVINADDKSLCLLDELGSGTDPQEGGAIAMAALDTLIQKEAFVLVTTHHGILKNYGYTHPSCINASVEFGQDTLAPTYRLLMGVPGESHAIDIALRSGLPADIVNQAKTYISTQQADVSTLIQGLTAKHAELDDLIKAQKIKDEELQNLNLKLMNKQNTLKEKEIELQKQEHTQSSVFLKETRKELENLVRYLREGEITREKTLAVKQFIAELEEDVNKQVDIIEKEEESLKENLARAQETEFIMAKNGMRIGKIKDRKNSSKKTKATLSNTEALKYAKAMPLPESKQKAEQKKNTLPSDILFQPGVEVYAGTARRKGVLIHKGKDNVWTVQFGSMKMNVPQRQLMVIPPKEQSPATTVSIETYSHDISLDTEKPVFELRLLGLRFEQAMKALEKQLDLCTIHNFRQFSIVHGKGSGILQQGVHDYLSHYPGVKEFRFAPPEEGGTGKTYVTLI